MVWYDISYNEELSKEEILDNLGRCNDFGDIYELEEIFYDCSESDINPFELTGDIFVINDDGTEELL